MREKLTPYCQLELTENECESCAGLQDGIYVYLLEFVRAKADYKWRLLCEAERELEEWIKEISD